MLLSEREREIMEAMSSIGKRNISMKEIASSLGITYNHLMKKRAIMQAKNGYSTFIGFVCDYVKEERKQ